MLVACPPGSFRATPLPCAELQIIWWVSEQMHRKHVIHRTTRVAFSGQQNRTPPSLQTVIAAKISWRVTKGYQQLQKGFHHKYTADSTTIYTDFALIASTKTPTLAITPSRKKGMHLSEEGAHEASSLPLKISSPRDP